MRVAHCSLASEVAAKFLEGAVLSGVSTRGEVAMVAFSFGSAYFACLLPTPTLHIYTVCLMYL